MSLGAVFLAFAIGLFGVINSGFLSVYSSEKRLRDIQTFIESFEGVSGGCR